MSCPYFDPVAPSNRTAEPRLSMLPLGDTWSGICAVDPLHPFEVSEADQRSRCNLGYARNSCSRFPMGCGPDAARFAISGDDGVDIRISWVLELDHHPFAHGTLKYSRAAGSLAAEPAASLLVLRQARAYVDTYLRKKLKQ